MKANKFRILTKGCKSFGGSCNFGGFETIKDAIEFGKRKIRNGEIEGFFVFVDSPQPQWYKEHEECERLGFIQ